MSFDNETRDSTSPRDTSTVVNLVGPQHPHRILFVDDEELILRAFVRDMAQSGIEITVCQSAAEGLAKLRHQPYSVVMSDFQMPGMDGILFFEEVRRIDPNSVRILVSGKADFDTAIRVINRVGLFSFVPKPWDSYEIRSTLQKALEHYAISLENRSLSNLLATKCAELGKLTASLESQVQVRTTSLLLGLVNALDLRDTETQWHSRRVAIYSRRLAEQIGLTGGDLLTVERGALLHDVGKIGVTDTIMLKPGKLTPEEWEEMKRHAEYGYQILKGIDFLGDARLLVWQHHERWDGKGYPRGLKGEQIYIGARIFAAIDTYDAMTSDRPYRKALAPEIAHEEIEKMSGTQFDPRIVEAWKQIPKEEIMALREMANDPSAGLD